MSLPTLHNDTFADGNVAAMSIGLFCGKDGLITNAIDILVRPMDVRGDESGAHPGETFVMLTLTREEIRAMAHWAEEDWASQVLHDGDPNEPNRRAEWRPK